MVGNVYGFGLKKLCINLGPIWTPGLSFRLNYRRVLSTYSNGRHVDIAIFGGGIIGSSIAYWLKHREPNKLSCAVIERDSTYSKCSTTLSVGGIRQQFSIEENIQLSLFSSKFLQNISKHLSVSGQDLPDINLTLNGYLLLATDSGAEQLIRNHKLQTQLGANIQLLSPKELKSRFPWINTHGLALGAYGVQNEGWFDPWALLMAFKNKSQSLGVDYIPGDIIGFVLRNTGQNDSIGSEIQTTNEVIIRQLDGSIDSLTFGTGIVCSGANSAIIANYLGYGSNKTGIRSVALPVEPRKRFVYVIHCNDGPGPQSPLLFDTSSVYFRPEGKSGNYLCGRSPEESEEPDVNDLEVDYNYFESNVWPLLAKRVKSFESIKLKNSWAGLYEYNCLDQNAVIGRDPYYNNIYWATGFSGHGIQMAPAVGRALSELLIDNKYKTIDLSRFDWNRILTAQPLKELNIY